MWRTLPAVASSTPANNDRYKIRSKPAPANVSATRTTIAETAAERVEIPKLGSRIRRASSLRRSGREDTHIV